MLTLSGSSVPCQLWEFGVGRMKENTRRQLLGAMAAEKTRIAPLVTINKVEPITILIGANFAGPLGEERTPPNRSRPATRPA